MSYKNPISREDPNAIEKLNVKLIKRAAIATVKFVKVAVKAIIAAAKAVVAAVKGIIAAIVAGGWVAVLIIVIIVIVACIVGSVYAIFVPAEDSEITIYSVTRDLEREHHEMENELAATVYYDVLNYDGNLAGWEEVIAVYAVKLNLDSEDPQEVATFDESKAAALRVVFLDMHELSLRGTTEIRKTERIIVHKSPHANLLKTIFMVLTIGMIDTKKSKNTQLCISVLIKNF